MQSFLNYLDIGPRQGFYSYKNNLHRDKNTSKNNMFLNASRRVLRRNKSVSLNDLLLMGKAGEGEDKSKS